MVIYGGGRRFREALEKNGFKIINELELFGNPNIVLVYILESSSAVYYEDGKRIFADVFPCDLNNPSSLPERVFSVLKEIPDDKNHEGEIFGVPFFITKPKRNNEFLGVNGRRKLVGFAGIYTNFRIFYYAGAIKTDEEILKSKNYCIISKRIKEILGDDITELRSHFGDELGYSAVFLKINKNSFLGITLHTWPESEIAHAEVFSDKRINVKKILKNLFKGKYTELSRYEKR